MKAFILLALCATSMAAPGYLAPALIPAHYAYHLGVQETPEVARAKAEHLATQAYEAARNTLGYPYFPAFAYGPAIAYSSGYGAPLGPDGRVIDTPEVAFAKAHHLAAHAQEAAKTIGLPYGALAYAYGYVPTAPLDRDGRVLDTPEVAQAKAAHLAAHAQEASKTAGH